VSDSLLRPFLDASDDVRAEQELALLLSEVASPVARDVLRGRLHHGVEQRWADDLLQDVLLQLMLRLRMLRARGASGDPIAHFKGYVAVVALRASDAFVRRRLPERNRFSKRLRYVLTRHPACALESSPVGTLCRLRTWAPDAARDTATARLRDLAASSDAAPALSDRDLPRMALSELVPIVLEWVGGPVTLDDLTSTLAAITGVRDRAQVSTGGDESIRGSLHSQSDSASHAGRLEARSCLRWLWEEIRELPSRQRAALLLNLRDDAGGGVLPLFVLTGIATFADVASVLDLRIADLRAVWPRLPADDATIAARMGVTRQQVINLRKAARLRLLRRSRRAGVAGGDERVQRAAIRPGAPASASWKPVP